MLTCAFTLLLAGLTLQGPETTRPKAVWVQNPTHEDGVADEFFSGSVQEFSESSVTVSRSLPGKSAETRVFVMDGETKVEGKLKKLARVTVGFHSHDGQDLAWRIIVRESPD